MKMIDLPGMEKKWQKRWEKEKAFVVKDGVKGKKKFYCLDMFPYPSGEGLHMGHAFVYTLGDIYARFKRLQGYNVLYPIGYDSLGLPAENAAIKAKTHPGEYTKKSIANFMKQQKAMGWSYDWSRMLKTSDPDFYKWDQWIFLKMFEKGLAYRKKAAVNWCRKCKTVLANEQVVNGRCWRHEDCEVEVKQLEQWFLKITDYADELIRGLDKLDWPERAKVMQRNWIGKSKGVEVDFLINDKKWKVFTTRVDTLFGVTFLVVSAQHPELMSIVSKSQEKKIQGFLKKIKSVSEKDQDKLNKEGVFTGSYAVHPLTGEKIPIWVGNFVVADYGSGLVMAVPGHDERDYEFAKKYKLKIEKVIECKEMPFSGYGRLVNSSGFNGLKSEEGKEHITGALAMKKLGRKKVAYRLKDWLISRQRYWGTPIPIVYCDRCGIVPEKDLPVKLPKSVKFGRGNPLLSNGGWIKVKCPKCGKIGRRETDTMDTFANSSWYFLRYCDPRGKKIFDRKKVDYWCPVDHYIGGPEHITMHLIYMRFYSKFLRDLGVLGFDEPAKRYFTQGIIYGSDGEKMSKSRGNVVEPLKMIERYGADTLRFYLTSNSAPDKSFTWSDSEIQGAYRFILGVYDFARKWKPGKMDKLNESRLNRVIRDYTLDIEGMRYNMAALKLRELFGYLKSGCDKNSFSAFLRMFSLFCPHLAEELWSKTGNKKLISVSKWPEFDKRKIDDKLEDEEKMVEKTIEDIKQIKGLSGIKNPKVYIYVIPGEVKIYEGRKKEIISSVGGKEFSVYAVNDSKKHDPEGKAKKAKPGRPGIYVE